MERHHRRLRRWARDRHGGLPCRPRQRPHRSRDARPHRHRHQLARRGHHRPPHLLLRRRRAPLHHLLDARQHGPGHLVEGRDRAAHRRNRPPRRERLRLPPGPPLPRRTARPAPRRQRRAAPYPHPRPGRTAHRRRGRRLRHPPVRRPRHPPRRPHDRRPRPPPPPPRLRARRRQRRRHRRPRSPHHRRTRRGAARRPHRPRRQPLLLLAAPQDPHPPGRLGVRFARTARPPHRIEPGGIVAEARGIRVELGGNLILDGVDLAARAGELVALVGPNGAGKSTLFAVIAGDLHPQAGSVRICGEPLTSWTAVELAMRRAVLPQQVSVSFPFLVHDVVRMGCAPWAGTPEEDRDDDVVAGALHASDVAHLAMRHFTSLSGGERARAAFARVLAQRSQLVLLDEPTAALDIHHQEMVLQLARSRAESGDAVVVVLHDLGAAAAYADRIILLSQGTVVADGAPGDVLTTPLLSSVYHHRVEVIPHPETGEPLVLPVRTR
ncbi:MAG: heme ABC transporter ATP-binding protein [Dehalococcoidia bacterium]|nr:heme ABC transporter ATP-binding protein [Dehalococcoidia bacterium]